MVAEDYVSRVVANVIRYMNSPEGRRQLEENLAAAQKTNEELARAERIDISLLLQPMTI